MNIRNIFLSIVIAGSLAYAQGPRQSGSRGGSTTPPTPAQMAQNETNRLTKFFTLTSTQEAAVLALLTTADTQIQALTAQIAPLRTTLETAIKANNQAQISSTVQQLSSLQEQEQVIRANAAGQIYATILTSAQQALVGTGLGPLMGGGGPGRGGFGGRR